MENWVAEMGMDIVTAKTCDLCFRVANADTHQIRSSRTMTYFTVTWTQSGFDAFLAEGRLSDNTLPFRQLHDTLQEQWQVCYSELKFASCDIESVD